MERFSDQVVAGAKGGDPVALARLMVAIPSVNPLLEVGGAGEQELSFCCADWLRDWGYRVDHYEVAPGRWNVVGRRGGGEPRLILNGHLDTVGVDGMEGDPFGGEERDGVVWGRGSCDMKGGLAIILATAAQLAREEFGGELVVALTADEEHASLGMQAFVEEVGTAQGAVVCEPTSLTVMPAHKGFLWMEAEFLGRAAHGSRPEEGVDAILHAARFLSAVERYQERLAVSAPHPLLGPPSLHAGTIQGGSAPSVYPDRCSVVLERRTLPGEDPGAIAREFQECLDEAGRGAPTMRGELRPGLFRPGTEVPVESALVQGILKALTEEGLPPRVEAMTAWVDAAFLNEAGIPAVCFGPGSIAQAHAAREWVPVEELRAGARVLSRFARTFLGG